MDHLPFIRDLIRSAGDILLRQFDAPSGISEKEDRSMVSDADRASSAFLCRELQRQFPDFAILDEESKEDGRRFFSEYCWVIDPLDGTRDYLQKGSDFGVLIGLTRNHLPIFGCAYRPMSDQLYWGSLGHGSYLEENGSQRRLSVLKGAHSDLVVSRSRKGPEFEMLVAKINPSSVVERGGSLKIVDVASGKNAIFAAPTSNRMSLWDLCAPQIILEEAGGRITDLEGQPFDYAATNTENHKGALAAEVKLHEELLSRIRS